MLIKINAHTLATYHHALSFGQERAFSHLAHVWIIKLSLSHNLSKDGAFTA
jgi:hypothetical protein